MIQIVPKYLKHAILVCFFCLLTLLLHTHNFHNLQNKKKFKALAMNSWMKNDWQTALNASKKFANKCFYTAIKSDFLLNRNNPLKYVQQAKGFIYYNPYWQKKCLLIQNAEQYLHQLTPYEVINWCERYPPKPSFAKNLTLMLFKH